MAAGGRRHLASTSVDTWTPLKQKKCRREVSTPSVQLKNSSKTAPRRAVGEKNKAFRRRHLASTLRNAGGPSVDAKCRASPAVAPLRRWWLIEFSPPVLDRIRRERCRASGTTQWAIRPHALDARWHRRAAHPEATAPLDWSELSPAIRPSHFTVDNLPRLRHLGSDQWAQIDQFANRWRRPAKHAVRACRRKREALLVGRLP